MLNLFIKCFVISVIVRNSMMTILPYLNFNILFFRLEKLKVNKLVRKDKLDKLVYLY